MNKAIKLIGKTMTTFLAAAVVLLCVSVALPRVIGMKPFAVLSGSMEPAYHVGSLIYVRPAQPEEIRVGDPITFVLNEELAVATHRVVRIDAESRNFYTKGDANDAEDMSPVYFKNLIGRPAFTIPYLGYVSAFINTKRGMILTVTVLAALAILAFLPDLMAKLDRMEQEKLAASNKKLEG